MQYQMRFAFSLLICNFLFFLAPAHAENNKKIEVSLATFNYPPLMLNQEDEKGRNGLGIDFLIEAFSYSKKFSLKVTRYPTKRAMVEFQQRRTDLFLGSRLDLPEVSSEIKAIQLQTLRSTLFCLQPECNPNNINKQFRNLGTIATIPDSPVNRLLESASNSVIELQELQSTFLFLLAERSDYVAAIDFAGFYTLKKMSHPNAEMVINSKATLMEIPYDVVIYNNHPYKEDIVQLILSHEKRQKPQVSVQDLVNEYLD